MTEVEQRLTDEGQLVSPEVDAVRRVQRRSAIGRVVSPGRSSMTFAATAKVGPGRHLLAQALYFAREFEMRV
jgi:hypothetical protein